MSHISLKGNSHKYCTCDAVGPVPSFLLTAQRGFKWAASTRPGPNDVRHVVWYFSFLLCFIVTNLNVDSISLRFPSHEPPPTPDHPGWGFSSFPAPTQPYGLAQVTLGFSRATRTRTPENPYPCSRVRVLRGTGTGFPQKSHKKISPLKTIKIITIYGPNDARRVVWALFRLCGPSLAFVGRHWLPNGYCGPSWACIGLRWPSLAAVGFRGPALAFGGRRWLLWAFVVNKMEEKIEKKKNLGPKRRQTRRLGPFSSSWAFVGRHWLLNGYCGPSLTCVGRRWPSLALWAFVGLRWPSLAAVGLR